MQATHSSTNRFLLTIDGKEAGFVKSIEGGGVFAQVISESGGPEFFVKKSIGAQRYEDLIIRTGFPVPPVLLGWIADSWTMKQQQHDFSILVLDACAD